MLDLIGGRAFPLAYRCSDRIVSISQSHVRPIVRDKAGKRVEFGAKLGLSLFGGYLTHQTISWDAYNEGADLQGQAETYRLLTGHYPELIQCDKIYHTNANRSWCSGRGIRMTAAPKGPKKKLSAYQKKKRRDECRTQPHRRPHWQCQTGAFAGSD